MGSRFLFAFGALFTVPGSFPRQGLPAVLFCFRKTKEKVSLYEYKISSRSRGPQDVENPVFPRRQAVFPAFPAVDTSVEDLWNRPLFRRRLLRAVESCGRLPPVFRKTRWKTPPACRAVFHSPEKWRRGKLPLHLSPVENSGKPPSGRRFSRGRRCFQRRFPQYRAYTCALSSRLFQWPQVRLLSAVLYILDNILDGLLEACVGLHALLHLGDGVDNRRVVPVAQLVPDGLHRALGHLPDHIGGDLSGQ